MRFCFLLSRRSFVAVICAAVLFILISGELKTALIPKIKDGADNLGRVNYILSLGYKVEETPILVKETVLPSNYPETFNQYILLQNSAGFPFEQFKGEKIVIYEYEDIQGNVISIVVSNGEIIGGHVLDGTSYEIKPLKKG